MAEMILVEEMLTPSLRAKMQLVQSSGRSLLFLINNILDLSRIEAGTVFVERANVDLRELSEHVLGTFRSLANSKGLACDLVVDEGVPSRCVTDPLRVVQILNNLMGTAFANRAV